MKRSLRTILCLLLIVSMTLSLTGCGLLARVLAPGEYVFEKMTTGGKTYTAAEVKAQLGDLIDMDDYISMRLDIDGTGVIRFMGEEYDIYWDTTYIWPQADNGEKAEYTWEFDRITLELFGETVTFAKK